MKAGLLLLLLLVAGCSSRPHEPRDQQIAVEPVIPAQVGAETSPTSTAAATDMGADLPSRAEPDEPRNWRVYREYRFNDGSAMVRPKEVVKSIDTAAYARQNPSAHFRVDGFRNDQSEDLGRRRLQTVRNSLIDAGVPAMQVEIGILARRRGPHEGVVQVQLSDR